MKTEIIWAVRLKLEADLDGEDFTEESKQVHEQFLEDLDTLVRKYGGTVHTVDGWSKVNE